MAMCRPASGMRRDRRSSPETPLNHKPYSPYALNLILLSSYPPEPYILLHDPPQALNPNPPNSLNLPTSHIRPANLRRLRGT